MKRRPSRNQPQRNQLQRNRSHQAKPSRAATFGAFTGAAAAALIAGWPINVTVDLAAPAPRTVAVSPGNTQAVVPGQVCTWARPTGGVG